MKLIAKPAGRITLFYWIYFTGTIQVLLDN